MKELKIKLSEKSGKQMNRKYNEVKPEARAKGRKEMVEVNINRTLKNGIRELLALGESPKEIALAITYLIIREMELPPMATKDIVDAWAKALLPQL